jgi:hypothetical protein
MKTFKKFPFFPFPIAHPPKRGGATKEWNEEREKGKGKEGKEGYIGA